MLGICGVCRRALPLSIRHSINVASCSALWALALYIPLSAPLGRLEAELSGTGLSESLQTTILVLSSLLMAAAIGLISQIAMSWALGPSWGASLGLMAVLSGAFWSLASRRDQDD